MDFLHRGHSLKIKKKTLVPQKFYKINIKKSFSSDGEN